MPRVSSHATGPPEEFARGVRQVVTTLASRSFPTIRLVAGALGTSTRTVQRRLSGAGLTYAAVVAQARASQARRMLEGADMRIADIAYTLGYSDAGHFTRAFLRWTGITPREFRRRHAAKRVPQRSPTKHSTSPKYS